MIIPVDIIKMNVTKNTIIFNNEIVADKLSIISVILFNFNNEDTIEHNSKNKYQIKSSIITGRFMTIIIIIIKIPNEFFIIKKLLNTEDNASPTPPPTIGINVPDTNLIPFKTRLSDELARILCVVRSPVKIVENNDSIIVIIFRIVLINLI